MPTDLSAHGYRSVNGEPVLAVIQSTLEAGSSMVQTWRALEPIVKALTEEVQARVNDHRRKFTVDEAAGLLTKCASVVRNVGAAAQGMLKASEGQARLLVVLQTGDVKPKKPSEMTEKQLIGVVVETLKKAHDAGKPCPVCATVPAIEVQPG